MSYLSIHCSVSFGSHDVHFFGLKCTQSGFKSRSSSCGCDLLNGRQSNGRFFSFIHSPCVAVDSVPVWRAVWRAACHFGWRMRSAYLPAMCLQSDRGGSCLRRDGDILWLPAGFRTGLWEDGSCERLRGANTERPLLIHYNIGIHTARVWL